ncbi:NAD(P)H-quinone oxidoreductase subunit S, chloroplastic [Juglans regia]|uniref:NAD(P)H-quinone oxidoreductase subunit S, chloroplastic n=1 Tax=Juglans regia TaxID=51240 RepID=A0A2I4E846_JUGRE|nr:NAD(P)H-quinone oxidoreductase subunit S, chloroplastic [Juglans regia]
MASSSIILPSIPGPPLKSQFLGGNRLFLKPFFTIQKQPSTQPLGTCAKFDLSQILGGRGLCNGEQGLQQELKRNIEEQASSASDATKQEQSGSVAISTPGNDPENAFEKELMGLTGGFPGGEKGLITFIERNPPPKKTVADSTNLLEVTSSKKPKAPELPLLMPGMIAIVNNPNNPYYMYCGIVQRITDGKAGVLFEGGNWDRLITFRLDELQRREKGPPLKNPKSAILEPLLEKKDSK